MGSCVSLDKRPGSVQKVEMSSIPCTPIKDNPIFSVGYKSQVSPFNSISSYRSHGSEGEAFYDTQAWLDSDCDDDFYSVNGDFSSRGDTPVHDVVTSSQYIRTFPPQVNRALFDGRPPLCSASNRSIGSSPLRRSSSAASPRVSVTSSAVVSSSKQNTNKSSTTRRKKLADLFRESFRERAEEGFTLAGYEKESSPNVPALPYNSSTNAASSTGTKSCTSNYVAEKEKSLNKVVQCGCFPRLFSSRTLRESKKASSPYHDYGSFKSVNF